MKSSIVAAIAENRFTFVLSVIVVFTLSLSVLYALGFIPEELLHIDGETVPRGVEHIEREDSVKNNAVHTTATEEPVRVVIASIGVDTPVLNPQTRNISELDEYLKQGTVRYPGSGLLGEGNMFIFGHSTGIRVVNNQAYKAFNNLGSLKVGDMIEVESTSKRYKYQVRNVYLANEDEVLVDFRGTEPMLTLSTCNTFGKKQERYVVEASYLGAFPL